MRLTMMLAAFTLLVPSFARAGVKIIYERKGQDGSTSTETLSLEGQRMRMDGMGGGMGRGRGRAGAVILDAQAKKMIMLNPEEKTYREMGESDTKALRERMEAMRANMPPEARQRMDQQMAGEVKYEPLKQKKTVGGKACEVHKVTLGDRVVSESCFAPWTGGVITKAEADQMKKVAAELQKLFEGMPGMRRQDWSKAPGIPVEETHFAPDGKKVATRTLTSVARAPIPASEFQVPADFKKDESPMMGGGRGMGPGGPGRGMGPGGPGRGPGPGAPPAAPPK